MNKFLSLSLLLTFSLSSAHSFAASDTCKQVENQCENAVQLANALYPYLVMGKDLTIKSYNLAHSTIGSKIPESFVQLAKPYLSNDETRSYLAHTALGLATFTALKMLQAVTAIPVAIVKFPFSNRPAMLVTGIIAKSIYDSYNQPNKSEVN